MIRLKKMIILDICLLAFMSELIVGLLAVPTSISTFPLFDATKTLVSLSFGHFLFSLCCNEGLCSAFSRLYRAWKQCSVCAQLGIIPPVGELSLLVLAASSPGYRGTVLKASSFA